MALDVQKIASAINDAIGATDSEGNPTEVTPEMEAYAEAVVNTLSSSIFNHPTGTVNGTTAPGAPLVAGQASGGIFAFVPGPTWLAALQSGFPTANPANLAQNATISASYIQTNSLINFEAGNITGQCTSTPTSPGPLVNGAGQDGKIEGLQGSVWATLVSPPTGDPSLSEKIYKAIVDQIKENASAEYASNTVIGTCPPGGGPLTAGTGTGGTVS